MNRIGAFRPSSVVDAADPLTRFAARHAHGAVPAKAVGVHLGEFVLGSGKADFESFQLAEPVFAFGLGDASQEVVADLDQATPLAGLRGRTLFPETRDRGQWVFTGETVGTRSRWS